MNGTAQKMNWVKCPISKKYTSEVHKININITFADLF